MQESTFTPETRPTRDASARPELPRGWTAVAWVLICLAVGGLLVLSALAPEEAEADRSDPIGLTVLKLQARMMVGLHVSGLDTSGQAAASLGQLNTGTIGQRLRVAIASAEVVSTERGLEVIEKLQTAVENNSDVDFTEDEARALTLIETLLRTDAEEQVVGASLTTDDREFLIDQLDWFGELALVRIDHDNAATSVQGAQGLPAREAVVAPAVRLAWLIVFGALMGIGLGLVGTGVLVALAVMVFLRRLRSGIRTDGPHYGVYAETFFVWFILFFALNTVASVLPLGLGGTVLAFFASMVALAYPVMRGIPWQRVREDIGLTLGRQPAVEPLLGPVGYAICLPLLVVGLLMTLVLMAISEIADPSRQAVDYLGPTGGPAHPIIQMIDSGDPLGIFLVFMVASVAAPIVEEVFFRGVLYAHLRGVSRKLGPWMSIALATFVNSFIFAVIHPQGFVAVPALMSLAIGMTILREWRGTLIPSILIHGISNGLVMTMVTVALAG